MTAFRKLTTVELKLFLREPAAVFFTLLLPLLLLALNSGETQPQAVFGGRSLIDILLPGYVVMVMMTAGIMALPETVATYRERGILRRLRATPVKAWNVLVAQAVVQILVVAVGIALLLAAAMALSGASAPASWPALALAVALAAGAVQAFGFLLAAMLPTARSTRALAAALYFPAIFLSGAVYPREAQPEFAQAIGDVLPFTYAVDVLGDAWAGAGINAVAAAVLIGTSLVSIVICSRMFRWE